MDAKFYWKGTLSLLWALMFFMLLSLVIGLVYLAKAMLYPYAIGLGSILVIFLAAFILFHKRVKAGFYLCILLSAIFILNQLGTLYLLLMQPEFILPVETYAILMEGSSLLFPLVVSALLLLWGILLFVLTGKSRPVFGPDFREKQMAWLEEIKIEVSKP